MASYHVAQGLYQAHRNLAAVEAAGQPRADGLGPRWEDWAL